MTKKLLYYHWGHLSDKKGISSPDGDSIWLIWALQEFMNRGWDVYGVVDRDKELVDSFGMSAFDTFSADKRWNTYNKINFIGLERALQSDFPEVDLVLDYWRMPTKDNQLSKDNPDYSPDLEIQNNILNYYKDKAKVVLLDLDYKLTKEDEEKIKPWKVLEQGIKPKDGHETIFIPFDFEEMFQFSTLIPRRNSVLTYIGNYYERDEDFNKKIFDYASKHPNEVRLFGNWMKDSLKELRDKNPNVEFNDRIGFDKMRYAYGSSVVVPLLAKDEYKSNGVMTARINEALFFGSIPIGFSDFYGIDKWLPKELIVNVENISHSMDDVIKYVKELSYDNRVRLRRGLIDKLRPMHDAPNFVNKCLEGLK